MSLPEQFDVRKADAEYKGFPTYEEWSYCVVDVVRWDRYSERLQQHDSYSEELLRRAREIVKRAAAIDTGAIEGLYEVDRGFTYTVAAETTLWESVLNQKGPEVKAHFEAQLHAYDYVLDFATRAVPVAEAWIRGLHEQICKAQDTYSAYTAAGLQELPLPKGAYKVLPNHVIGRDGKLHSYAPVDLAPAEMYRLCEQLRSEAFEKAHPVLQASYAHYAFIRIHPFADGNGRVARALASVYTYRAHSIPLLILAENRAEYIDSLQLADAGDYQPFVNFVLERSLDGIKLVEESLNTAKLPPAEDALEELRRLYVTRGGYRHADVDQAGIMLVEHAIKAATDQIGKLSIDNAIRIQADRFQGGASVPQDSAYRTLMDGTRGVRILASSATPAEATAYLTYVVEVPKDCGLDDDLVLRNAEGDEAFEARITELTPAPSAALQMRLSIFVERVIRKVLRGLAAKATEAARGQGLLR